jgi:protein tyrosine phosphatase
MSTLTEISSTFSNSSLSVFDAFSLSNAQDRVTASLSQIDPPPGSRLVEWTGEDGRRFYQVMPYDCPVERVAERLRELFDRMVLEQPTEPSQALDSFPEFEIRLSDLPTIVEGLRLPENRTALERVWATIKQRARRDTSLPVRKEANQPATFVQTPKQNFIFAPVPKNSRVAAYIQKCLAQRVRVLVSVHEFRDADKSESPKFWDQAVLSSLDLGGWKIEAHEIKTIPGSKKNIRGEIPSIVVTSLNATHPYLPPHTMTHLYITRWVDRSAASDETLLLTLHELMQSLSPYGRDPIAINCGAGRYRTLITGVSYALRRQIYETWIHGGDIRNMVINVPELIYHIGQQRDLTLRSITKEKFPLCYLQILSVTSAYVQSLLSATCANPSP